MCAENHNNYTIGCVKCDDCYSLVVTRVGDLRSYVSTIQVTLTGMLEDALKNKNSQDDDKDDREKDENFKLITKLQSLKLLAEQVHRKLFENLLNLLLS